MYTFMAVSTYYKNDKSSVSILSVSFSPDCGLEFDVHDRDRTYLTFV
jgi:hypothetical protein